MLDISGTTAIVNNEVKITLARFDVRWGELTVSTRPSDLCDDPATGGPVLNAFDANGSALFGTLVYPNGNDAAATLVVAAPGGRPSEKVTVKSPKSE